MVNLLEKLFGSFVSAITSYCVFQYHHPHHQQGTNKHKMTKATRPLSLQTVELKVRMCCSGCERVIKDAVYKLRGVESVSVELEMEKVTVVGYVDRNRVLKAVRRHGKRAEFWPYPNPPLYFTSSNNYFKDMNSEYRDSYNYWRHGYNVADKHGNLHVTHRGDDKVSNLFNDDNVNACCIM
ncbi:heavy metal-associated isoprenylated plant protein 30-like [Solanum stenotomum]|uniref:heavy metal-associated isoprenylated plant protein 30-like n=1 Tax=Solanum stenotomum TaxID=172797 RepID=UPI0020D0CE9F|nr:heavy metal-associated isoprenylated plant protein 30-like [Solanum stenotomum]